MELESKVVGSKCDEVVQGAQLCLALTSQAGLFELDGNLLSIGANPHKYFSERPGTKLLGWTKPPVNQSPPRVGAI